MIEDINKYMIGSCFEIILNASDFFQFATACAVTLTESDFDWAFPFIKEWGDEGLYAVMAYITKHPPIKPYQTPRYLEAYAALCLLEPEVFSE